MNTVGHLVWKDVRRLTPWLLVWWALAALAVAMHAGVTPATGISGTVFNVVIARAWGIASVVLFVVIVCLTVQEDPLVDSRAFWLTRPITGRTLLMSKLAFIALAVAVPGIIVDVVRIATLEVEPRVVAFAVPQVLLDWCVWTAILVALASFATTLAGTLWTAIKTGALGLLVGAVMLARWLPHSGPLPPGTRRLISDAQLGLGALVSSTINSGFAPASWFASRTIAVSLIAIASALVVAWCQYAWRRPWRSWLLVTTGLVCASVCWTQWRWNFFRTTLQPVRAADAERITVTLSRDGLVKWGFGQAGGTAQRTVWGRFSVGGLGPQEVGEVAGVAGTLTLDENTVFPLRDGATADSSSWDPAAVERLIGNVHLTDDAQAGAGWIQLASAPALELIGRQRIGRIDGHARLLLRRYRIAAALPLRRNQTYSHADAGFTIMNAGCQGQGCQVVLDQHQLSLLFAPNELGGSGFMVRRYPNILYVLVNRGRHELLWPNAGPMGGDVTTGFGWTFDDRVDSTSIMLVYPPVGEDWLRNAELVRVEAQTLGVATHDVRLDGFVLNTEPAAAGRSRPEPQAAPMPQANVRREQREALATLDAILDEPGSLNARAQVHAAWEFASGTASAGTDLTAQVDQQRHYRIAWQMRAGVDLDAVPHTGGAYDALAGSVWNDGGGPHALLGDTVVRLPDDATALALVDLVTGGTVGPIVAPSLAQSSLIAHVRDASSTRTAVVSGEEVSWINVRTQDDSKYRFELAGEPRRVRYIQVTKGPLQFRQFRGDLPKLPAAAQDRLESLAKTRWRNGGVEEWLRVHQLAVEHADRATLDASAQIEMLDGPMDVASGASQAPVTDGREASFVPALRRWDADRRRATSVAPPEEPQPSAPPAAESPGKRAFTLSQDALLSLAPADDSISIEGRRKLPGAGVELDLRWNRPGVSRLVLPNDTIARLRGLTPAQFSQFEITYELLSLDGAPPTAELGAVGCIPEINGYGAPTLLSAADGDTERTAFNKLQGSVEWLSIGIYPTNWSTKKGPAPHRATVVLEPADDAEVLPNARIDALPRSRPPVPPGTFTLDDAGLLALDCHGQTLDAPGAEIGAVHDVDGPGVEFDLHFSADRDPKKPLYWVSSFDCGKHRLVNGEVGASTKFALDMRVVKVNGHPPDAAMALRAGPSFNGDWDYSQPLHAGFPGRPVVQTMVILDTARGFGGGLGGRTTSAVDEIGFRFYLDDPAWAHRDVTLTLRVEPTPGATPLRVPETSLPSFTLSDEALMRLEPVRSSSPILARRDVEGPGVEFDFKNGPLGEYDVPSDILTSLLPEANAIGGSFALEFALVDSVPKMKDGDDGWAMQAVTRGRERPTLITPARPRRPGIGSTILRGPIDRLGVSAVSYSSGPGIKPADKTERVVTILIKPADGATVLP